MRRPLSLLTAVALAAACSPNPPAEHLYLWVASADTTQPDFLATLDVTAGSERYGQLVGTVPVPGRNNGPHHTDHELAPDRQLFANGFRAGRTFIFDLSTPNAPRLAGDFTERAGYAHPHSFILMPNGNRLGTFHMRHDSAGMHPGGLVELTPTGEVVRSSAPQPASIDAATRVYSAAVVESLDRIVSTTTDMVGDSPASRQVQIWRLSDFALLHTIVLPDGPAGGESMYTAEPRLLADGKTVIVSTFNCSLYLLDGIETDAPSGRLVASFPRKGEESCAIPVVRGNHYVVTVPAYSGVVSLDITDPSQPREVSRVAFDSSDVPHWISMSPDGKRIVVTGYESLRHRVELLHFDEATGALTRDTLFRDAGAATPGVRLDNKSWPHGGTAAGIPHGAVFSRPAVPK
jgi:hypothetical protein